MASPLRTRHGVGTYLLSAVFAQYQARTPGVQGMDNATAILSSESEPQPDVLLRLLPECGGRTTISNKDFLTGPPELIVEVAQSSAAIDLFEKKADYHRAEVLEYLVLCVSERELRAFDLRSKKAIPIIDGVFRSNIFPGLWIDVVAILDGDATLALRTGRKGLQSPDHKAFATKLNMLLKATRSKTK